MSCSTPIKLPRAAKPEDAGVSSSAVLAMIKDIETSGAEEHGFMIIRHGIVAIESFKHPYSADNPHIMYSASKAVTATAIGFALEEGLLSLETKILDILTEFRPRKRDEKLERVNIKHLMTMQAGKMPNILSNKTKDKWLNHFFDGKWIFNPGEGWEYVNENIYLLCAILVRITGMSVTQFLTPRLWEPLGIETPYWETDPRGVESGGWGLFLSAESLAKFVLCYLQGGVFEGGQVIPAEWAKTAVLNHKKLKDNEEPNREEGYGYCFWREGGDKRSYRAEGMFSEIGLVFEEHDAVFVTLGGEMNAGKTHRYIFDHFPKGFTDTEESAQPNAELQKAIAARQILPLPASERSKIESVLQGKKIKFKSQKILNILGFPMSVLPLAATYMTKDRAGNIDNVVFGFSKSECSLTWTEGDEKNTVLCGMDGKYRTSKIRLASTDYTAYSCAAWRDDNTLEVWIIPIESIGRRMLTFTFTGKKVQMKPSTVPDLSVMINSLSGGVTEVYKNKMIVYLARKVIKIAEKMIEPVHMGRFKQ